MATRNHRLRLLRRVPALAAFPILLTQAALALPRQDPKPAVTAPAAPDTTYALTRAYKTDEESKYRLELRTNVNSADVLFTTTLTEKAKEVKPAGDTTLVYTASAAYLKFGDNEMDASESLPTVTQIRDNSGKVTDTKVVQGNGPAAQIFGDLMPAFIQAQLMFYPPKPVKVGDTWKIDYANEKSKSKVTGKATVIGTEKVGDLDTLKVKVSSSAKLENAPGEQSLEGVGNIETATGRFVRLVGTSSGNLGPTGKTKIDVTLTLMKGDAKIDEAKKDDKPAPAGKTDKPDKEKTDK